MGRNQGRATHPVEAQTESPNASASSASLWSRTQWCYPVDICVYAKLAVRSLGCRVTLVRSAARELSPSCTSSLRMMKFSRTLLQFSRLMPVHKQTPIRNLLQKKTYETHPHLLTMFLKFILIAGAD